MNRLGFFFFLHDFPAGATAFLVQRLGIRTKGGIRS